MIGLIKGTARQAKTVSGLPLPIASYKSNSKAPIQELSLSINPTQSGSGDPYPAGGGKNICDISTWTGHTGETSPLKNPIPANTQITISALFERTPDAPGQCAIVLYYTDGTNGQSKGFDVGTGTRQSATLTTNKEVKSLYFYSIAGYWSQSQNYTLTVTDLQIELGSTATDYAPYSNIRPITGVSSVNVARTGKNLFDITKMSDRSGVTVSGNTFSGLARSFTSSGLITPFFAKSGSVLTVQATTKSNGVVTSGAGFALLFVYADNTTVRPWYTNNNETSETHHIGTVTATSDIVGYRFVDYNSGTDNTWTVKDFMIELGSTASDYSPYQGNTYTIALGDTYYGATLDVVSGKLSVTHWLDEYDGSNDETWTIYSSSGLRYSYFINRSHIQPAISSLDKWKSNSIPVSGSSENTPEDVNRITCRGTFYSSKNLYIFAPPTDIPDITALRSYLNNQPLQFWYPITPIEIDLTPTQINSLLGSNNVWHDGNGDVEVLKFMDRQLYFGR